MFAEWVTEGVSWGIKLFSAAFTLFAILGFFFGVMAIIARLLKGLDDEPKDI